MKLRVSAKNKDEAVAMSRIAEKVFIDKLATGLEWALDDSRAIILVIVDANHGAVASRFRPYYDVKIEP